MVELYGVGRVPDGGLRVEQTQDAVAGGDALIDGGEGIREGAHGAGYLGEYGEVGKETARIELAARDEDAAEDEQSGCRRDAEEFAHGRGQLLTVGDAPRDVGEFAVDVVEAAAEKGFRIVSLYHFHSRERFVEYRSQFAERLLYLLGRTTQAFHYRPNQQRHDGQVDDREEGELDGDGQHGDHVEQNDHLQRVGDAELHDLYVGGDAGHDVALAFVAEKTEVHAQDVFVYPVAQAAERPHAHVLDNSLGEVAEKVAQQRGGDDHAGEHYQHVHDVVVAAEQAVEEIGEQGADVVGQMTYAENGHLGNGLQRSVGGEQRIDDGHYQREGTDIEECVQQRAEKIGYGVFLYRFREAEQSPVCLHLFLNLLNGAKVGKNG